jgi:hypothetical protein
MEEEGAKQAAPPATTPFKNGGIHPRLTDTAVALPVATSFLFLTGWLYFQNYYRFFSIDHRTLGIPFHTYLVTPWFMILGTLIYLPVFFTSGSVGVSLGARIIQRNQRIATAVTNGQPLATRDKVWIWFGKKWGKVFLFVMMMAPLGFFAWMCWMLVDAINVAWTYAIYPVAYMLFYVYLEPLVSAQGLALIEKRAVRSQQLVATALAVWLMASGARQGTDVARLHSYKWDKTFPEVVLVWNEVPKDSSLPDPIKRDAYSLKLLWASTSELYVFNPRESVNEPVPKVYCIPRDKLRYYVQR